MIVFYKVVALLSHVLPYTVAVFITERVADGAYLISHRRARRVVVRNLSRVFPLRKEKELASIALKTFRNFARFIYEFIVLPRLNSRNMGMWLVPIHPERVEQGLSKGKGVIVLTAHLGNWELGAAFLALSGHPLTVVAMDHPSKAVTDFFTERRLVHNMRVVSLKEAARETVRALRGNRVVALLGDRDYTGTGQIMNFFGEEALVPTGALSLGTNLGCEVLPAFAVREGGRYSIHFDLPLQLQKTEDRETDLKVNLSKWVRVLETYVKKYPEQWFVFDPIWRRDEGRRSHASLQ